MSALQDLKNNVVASKKTTFVIPIVHPSGKKVSDYSTVERILTETIASITSAAGNARVLVVCHQVPDWHARFSDRVTFLNLADHWAFSAGRNDVRVDKGMKYCAAIWFALADHAPDFIVPFDGDDFVRHDFCLATSTQLEKSLNVDGLLIEGGYNVALAPRDDGFALMAALQVRAFDRTCGSCRVLRAAKLRSEILRMSPQLAEYGLAGIVNDSFDFKPEFLDVLVRDADPIAQDDDALIQVLGRHLRQEEFFRLERCPLDIVAKGCGHGNHDGPRAGEVHWNKLKGMTPNRRFLKLFGLSGRSSMRSEPHLSYQLKGVSAFFRQKLRAIKVLIRNGNIRSNT